MTYQPPPIDEPWTPGHRDRSCMCNLCREEAKKHLALLEAEMDRQYEEEMRKRAAAATAQRAPSKARRRQPRPARHAEVEFPAFTHSFRDLVAMVSGMFLERVCFIGLAPVHLVNKKDKVRSRVKKRKERP